MSTHGSYHNHSSPNYHYYGNHQQQQQGYNPRSTNYSSFGGSGSYTAADHDYFARQFWDQYETPVFQPPLPSHYSVDIVLPLVVDSPYGQIWIYPVSNYEQIDDVYVVNDPSELIQTSGHIINDMTSQLTGQERNSNFEASLYGIVLHLLDDMYDHDHEEKEDEDDVLKYLKIRTHHAPPKDGVDSEVVAADVESEICAICHSEYEHEENIGALQCGHEYHTDCIKKWLLKKKDCPMCRASVFPSQE